MTVAALTQWQDAFAQALVADDPRADAPAAFVHLVEQPGFAVYRNTALTGCIDALQANFPAVERLVGEPWFRAAAAIYARSHLPRDPALLTYGEDFADFLESFEPASELGYLPDVARVDRLWSEAHVAADDAVLDASALGELDASDMDRLGLRPHAAARWTWFDGHPIHTVWSRNRHDSANHAAPIEWIGEGVLLTRPYGAVIDHAIGRAGIALLAACADGRSIADGVAAALEADAETDISELIGLTLRAGAFACLRPITSKDTP
jgi:Putative DNA-binding domain